MHEALFDSMPGKRSSEQDAFDDFALELCAGLDPVHQFSAITDLVSFTVRLGGDRPTHSQEETLDQAVFDRTKYSLQKLRHFRFMVMGLVVRALSNRRLFEKLGEMDDGFLYHAMLPVGRCLMMSSVELDEFIAGERSLAEETEDQQTLRYWIALSGRAETVSEKLRHLLPGEVAATVITDILEDDNADSRMREKALQLANSKLIHDGYFSVEGGISVQLLERMAAVLNKWITKDRRGHEQASEYQTVDECLIGNILLLSGELIRSLNMKSTMVSAVPLLKTCLSILRNCISDDK
ncbi:hypothetical protein OSTOST_21988, partial [Ostertagia ostertagi]